MGSNDQVLKSVQSSIFGLFTYFLSFFFGLLITRHQNTDTDSYSIEQKGMNDCQLIVFHLRISIGESSSRNWCAIHRLTSFLSGTFLRKMCHLGRMSDHNYSKIHSRKGPRVWCYHLQCIYRLHAASGSHHRAIHNTYILS